MSNRQQCYLANMLIHFLDNRLLLWLVYRKLETVWHESAIIYCRHLWCMCASVHVYLYTVYVYTFNMKNYTDSLYRDFASLDLNLTLNWSIFASRFTTSGVCIYFIFCLHCSYLDSVLVYLEQTSHIHVSLLPKVIRKAWQFFASCWQQTWGSYIYPKGSSECDISKKQL